MHKLVSVCVNWNITLIVHLSSDTYTLTFQEGRFFSVILFQYRDRYNNYLSYMLIMREDLVSVLLLQVFTVYTDILCDFRFFSIPISKIYYASTLWILGGQLSVFGICD